MLEKPKYENSYRRVPLEDEMQSVPRQMRRKTTKTQKENDLPRRKTVQKIYIIGSENISEMIVELIIALQDVEVIRNTVKNTVLVIIK